MKQLVKKPKPTKQKVKGKNSFEHFSAKPLTKAEVEASRSNAYKYSLQLSVNAYDFYLSKKSKEKDFLRHHFRFTTDFKRRYIVFVDEYPNSVFIVKFFLKNHRLSKNKFRLLIGDFDAKKVLDTMIGISAEILKSTPLASFGFLGEPLLIETSKKKTKRFRVYFKYATKHYNPKNWIHLPYYDISGYLLLNKKNREIDKEEIETYFSLLIDF